MHLIVTALVVIFSLTALILSIIGTKKEGMNSVRVLTDLLNKIK